MESLFSIFALAAVVVVWYLWGKARPKVAAAKTKSKAWFKRERWRLGAAGIGGMLVLGLGASLLDKTPTPPREPFTPRNIPSSVTNLPPSSPKPKFEETIVGPGKPLVIRLEPNWKLDYPEGLEPMVEQNGADKIVTFSSDKEMRIRYRRYR